MYYVSVLPKNRAATILLIMALILVFAMFTPSMVWASSGGTAADGLDVTMGEDGTITIEGGGGLNFNSADGTDAWNDVFTRYKNIIVAFSGLCTLTMLAVFIFLFAKLGTVSANEKERRSVITGILFSGIATAALGSVTVIMAFFYNAFGNM